jgi:hypothetical protein
MRIPASLSTACLLILPILAVADPEPPPAPPPVETAPEKLASVDKAALKDAASEAYRQKDFKKSAKLWKQLRDVDANDWLVRAELICAYEAAGEFALRDQEIVDLRELRKAGKIPDLNEATRFHRDTFEIGDVTAFVFEFFEMTGDQPLIWKFRFRKNREDVPFIVVLESDEADTASARQLGVIGKDDRIYSVDRYNDDGSEAFYGMFHKKPDYADIKKRVIAISKDAVEPDASFQPGKK